MKLIEINEYFFIQSDLKDLKIKDVARFKNTTTLNDINNNQDWFFYELSGLKSFIDKKNFIYNSSIKLIHHFQNNYLKHHFNLFTLKNKYTLHEVHNMQNGHWNYILTTSDITTKEINNIINGGEEF